MVTSFAWYLCPTLIDKYYRPDMTYEDAWELLVQCFRVIYSRFKLATNQVDIVFQTEEGLTKEWIDFDINFGFQGFINKEDLW